MDLSNESLKFKPRTPTAAAAAAVVEATSSSLSSETTKLLSQQQQQPSSSSATILDGGLESIDNQNWNNRCDQPISSSSLLSSTSSLDYHHQNYYHRPELDKGDNSSSGGDGRGSISGSDTSDGGGNSDQSDPKTVSTSLAAISVTDTTSNRQQQQQEYQQYKLIIGERLKRLEQFIEQFRLIVEPRPKQQPSTIQTDTMMITAAAASALETTTTAPATIKLPPPPPLSSSSSVATVDGLITKEYRTDDLKTVLSEIDQHLSILKEIEQRNTIICETFSKEIRSRDEALLDKMKEISMMNQEMATMQARMQHLMLKNTQLESEIKYLKTISSYTNTESTSTPILANDDHGGLPRQMMGGSNLTNSGSASTTPSSSLFGVLTQMQPPPTMDDQSPHQHLLLHQPCSTATASSKMGEAIGRQQQHLPVFYKNAGEPMMMVKQEEEQEAGPTTNTTTTISGNKISTKLQHPQQAAIYHDLLIQYRKIEQLIQQKEVYKLRDTTHLDGNFAGDDRDGGGKAEIPNPEPCAADDDDEDQRNDSAANQTTPVTAVEKFDLESGSSEMHQQKMLFDMAESVSAPDAQATVSSSLNPAGNLDSNPPTDGQPPSQQQEQQREEDGEVVGERQLPPEGKEGGGDGGEEAAAKKEDPFGGADFNLINNEDVVATSIKAYEHFVKMQHDLEILMRKESEYRARIIELERENEQLRQKVKDDEYNLSDVQYELDILKHNYELEIESFSTAINERETLIEKLQQKMQNLKAKYMKLDDRLKMAQKVEIELHAQIEELQGRLKYEQVQKQALIDLRISELESKLQQQEQEYRLEIQNLRTDLVCKETVCKEMEKKIEDLENSLKSLTSADFEDEFVYYKNQIDTLIKDLDKEKQEHQRCREQLEQELRNKDKLLEQAREQLKREKDLRTREKTEHEQRMRKMLAKLKSKEEEIKLLHEKIVLLSEKFQNLEKGTISENQVSSSDHGQDGHGQDPGENPTVNGGGGNDHPHNAKRPEQLLTELTLKEIKMNEMKERLEEYEEQLKQLKEQLFQEHDRRRKLETFYLNQLNKKNKYWHDDDYDDYDYDDDHDHGDGGDHVCDGLLPKPAKHALQDMDSTTTNHHQHHSHQAHHHHHYNNGPYHRRDSTSSFSLLMDESVSSIHDRQMMAMANVGHKLSLEPEHHHHHQQQSYWIQMKRWLRRQKNIFMFGRTKAKLIRILLLVYVIWLHYLAVDYYLLAKPTPFTTTVQGGANRAAATAKIIASSSLDMMPADQVAANTGGRGFGDDEDGVDVDLESL